jgi:ubiquinone/menaquinone biosynthesis C-methylase UbiE
MNNKITFADHFSAQSSIYAQARPNYPHELFRYIASLCSQHFVAWDCGTGNGQSANSLSNYFNKVIATDPSQQQLQQAIAKDNIAYVQSPAEYVPFIKNNSVDLITVATALHWFDTNLFYAEADRVLQPNGIIAVWSYWGNSISPEIDKLLHHFAYEFLLPYWPNGAKKNWIVKYADVTLPFTKIETPDFQAKHLWNLQEMKNYMMSWSAVNKYITIHQSNPLNTIMQELEKLWGNATDKRLCVWDLVLLVSKKKGS